MRLVTYDAGEGIRPGLLRGRDVIDLGSNFRTVAGFINAGETALAAGRKVLESASAVGTVDQVRLHAPLGRSGEALLAVGWNYPAHFDEGSHARGDGIEKLPEHPSFFCKAPTSVTDPYASIPHDPRFSEQLDYEAELAVVIGRAGRNIPRDAALSHIFGYMLANDVTARDVQRRHGGQWFKGKSLDRSCPLGPVLVTTDEIADPQAIELICEVNGEPRQHGNTAGMAFPIAELLQRLSEGMTLLPGSIVLTGTPPGVGYARTPPRFLQPGDEVVVRSPQLGELRNRIVSEDLVSYLEVEKYGRHNSQTTGETAV